MGVTFCGQWVRLMRSSQITLRPHRSLMTYTESDYVIRKATDNDRDVIKSVSREALMEGYKTDYMAGMIDVYLQDTNRLVYVAERVRDQKVIGAAMAHGGLDDGITYQGEAGRATPEYQNKGVLRSIIVAASKEIGERWPQWDHFKGSSTQTHFYDQILHKIDMQCKRFAIRIRLGLVQLEQFVSRDDVRDRPVLRGLSSDGLSETLNDVTTRDFLYPEGYMILEHNIMRSWPSNLKYVTNYHSDMHISGDVTSGDAALSIGGLMTVNDANNWRYNFNYTGSPSVTICKHHLRHVLRHNMNVLSTRPETYVILMMPLTFHTDYGQDKLLEYWGKEFGVTMADMTPFIQYAFEYKKGESIRNALLSPSDIMGTKGGSISTSS